MKKISIIFLFLWLAVIFMFSHQEADKSSKLSDTFIYRNVELITKVFNIKIDDTNKEMILTKYTTIVRKSAHFIVYLILGILMINVVRFYSKKIIIYSLLYCLIYALSDEIHQMFIVGRSGELRDVLIDFMGSTIGIYLFILLSKTKYKKLDKRL